METSLVTGATGFLGSHLAEALMRRGEKVRALVRSADRAAHLESLGVELVIGSLSHAASLRKAVSGTERVYHCAALVSDWGPWSEFRAVNVTGAGAVLEASREAGVRRFIHISTTDVYGYPDHPVDETAPFRIRGWPYGDTKIEGEKLAWEYFHRVGLPVTAIRPDSIYGPRSASFVVELVNLLKSGSMMTIQGSRKPAGLAYVGNVVDLILLAADSAKAVGEAYNAADGSEVSWSHYIQRLAEIVGVPVPRASIPDRPAYAAGWALEKIYALLHIPSRPLLTRLGVEIFGTNLGFSIDKARRDLGYEPRVGFDEGMGRVAEWLQAAGYVGRERVQ